VVKPIHFAFLPHLWSVFHNLSWYRHVFKVITTHIYTLFSEIPSGRAGCTHVVHFDGTDGPSNLLFLLLQTLDLVNPGFSLEGYSVWPSSENF